MRFRCVSTGILVLALTLFTTSFAGAAGGPYTPADRPVANRPAPAPADAVTRTLFVRVPGKAGAAERSLEVRVRFDGHPYLTEKIAVQPSRQDIDVELLARDAKVLERLFGLADRKVGEVSIAVLLDGKVLHEMTLQELENASASLVQSRGFHPVPAVSKVELLVPEPGAPDFPQPAMTKGYEPDPECEQACDDTYVTCYYEICDQRGDCSYCWDDYESCVAHCPQICVDPKRVYDFTSLQLLGSVSYGFVCRELPFQTDYRWGEWFEYRRDDWKHTRIRRTEYCNGTYSDQVLSVTYSSTYCHYTTYSICSHPSLRLNSWEICY